MAVNEHDRDAWVQAVSSLSALVQQWCEGQQWPVVVKAKEINERRLGVYTVPFLRARTIQGEVLLDPIARDLAGDGDGRVDLSSWPNLRRVMLIRTGNEWRVWTDSGVRIRKEFSEQLFRELVDDLTADHAA